jgi:hypothetical protein
MKPREYYEQLIASLPVGRERAVLRVMTWHVGQAQAVRKDELMLACEKMGVRFSDERQVRLTIVELRKRGVPICSSSGDAGYYLPATMDEYREFRAREYVKKIIDMRETVTAMDDQVRAMFPADYARYLRDRAAAAGQPSLWR